VFLWECFELIKEARVFLQPH